MISLSLGDLDRKFVYVSNAAARTKSARRRESGKRAKWSRRTIAFVGFVIATVLSSVAIRVRAYFTRDALDRRNLRNPMRNGLALSVECVAIPLGNFFLRGPPSSFYRVECSIVFEKDASCRFE